MSADMLPCRLVLVLAVAIAALVGCDPFAGASCADAPWVEHVIARTAAATLVAETRERCGLPDELVAYDIYRTASPWQLIASGSMQTQAWARAVDTNAGVTHLHLYDRTCVLDATALRCTDHPATALDSP